MRDRPRDLRHPERESVAAVKSVRETVEGTVSVGSVGRRPHSREWKCVKKSVWVSKGQVFGLQIHITCSLPHFC